MLNERLKPVTNTMYRISQSLSLQSGIQGWNYPSDPGMEFLGMTAYNASYTGMRWAFTYIAEPDSAFQDQPVQPYISADHTPLGWLQQYDNQVRFAQAGQPYANVTYAASSMRNILATVFCPPADPNEYGAITTTALTNASVTVCVYNCGVLPWRFSRTYAAAGSTRLPVTVPYQRFSMTFSRINAVDFQTNNHIAFDRDLFQLR